MFYNCNLLLLCIIYNHNDSGLYYKTAILANLALARLVNYNRRIVNYDCKEGCKLFMVYNFYTTGNRSSHNIGVLAERVKSMIYDPGLTKVGAGNSYWKGRISTIDLLVLTSSHQLILYCNIVFLLHKTSYLNGEVNATEPYPSYSLPYFGVFTF